MKEDCLKIKEEELVTRAIDIFDAMPQNVFKRAWLNTILKEEDFDGEVEKLEEDEELTIAEDYLEKEEEEFLVERFNELTIQQEDEEVKEVPALPRLPKNSPKKQSKITSFFK